MTSATVVAVVAACIAVLALIASTLILRKVRGHERILEREIERGKSAFDEVVERELAQRAEDLQQTLAQLRADSLSQLAEEERRIAEERRRDVAERERDATGRLSEQLIAAQAAVEQRLADWANDVAKLQESLSEDVKRVETRQQALMAEATARIGQDAEGLQSSAEEQRQQLARLRADLAHTAQEVIQQANSELEQHAAERRHALHEIADRLRKRERDLQELIEREGNEATQRIQLALGDIERRQVEQLQRIIGRETARYTEAASGQFDATIRAAREEAARRLSRELDLAVERFAREAEAVLTERLNAVSDSAAAAGRGAPRPASDCVGAPTGRPTRVARGALAPGRVRIARAFARNCGRCRVRAGGHRGTSAGARP